MATSIEFIIEQTFQNFSREFMRSGFSIIRRSIYFRTISSFILLDKKCPYGGSTLDRMITL